jgi:hypothetical protein
VDEGHGEALTIVFIRFEARPAVPRVRAPLLERMLARASGRQRVEDWRAHAYRLLADGEMPAPGPVALFAAAGAVAETCAYVASPVHHTAGISSVSLAAGAILPLERGEAEALARDFNRFFGDAGMRLTTAGPSGTILVLAFAGTVSAATRDPEAAVQGDLWDFQPRGADASRLRGIMSELEMWLFDHPVNRERAARAAAPVTGLWLWGGGATLHALPEIAGWTAGTDPLFGALGSDAGSHWQGSGVVVLNEGPGSAAWDHAVIRWLQPAANRLTAGRLRRLELSAGDALFSVDPRWRFRVWRRVRPWWQQLHEEAV